MGLNWSSFFVLTITILTFLSCSTDNEQCLTQGEEQFWILSEKDVEKRGVGSWGLHNSNYIILSFKEKPQEFKFWYCLNKDDFYYQLNNTPYQEYKGTWEMDGDKIIFTGDNGVLPVDLTDTECVVSNCNEDYFTLTYTYYDLNGKEVVYSEVYESFEIETKK